MSLEYRIIPNPLTVEPSYRSEVIQNIVTLDQVIVDLSLLLPQVGAGTIALVINGLKDVIESKLTEGYSVSLDDFARFFHSIPGRLDTPDSTVTSSAVQVNAAISTSIEGRVRDSISLSRIPFQEKTPSIALISEAGGKNNFLGQMMVLKGSGLDFDSTKSDEGVFFVNTHTGTGVRPSQYALVTNTQVIALNDVVTTPVATQYNEFLIDARVRYTPNGSLRTGTSSTPTRYYRQVVDDDGNIDNNVLFYSNYSGTEYDSTTVDDITYDNSYAGNYQFSISMTTDLSGVIREDSRLSVTVVDQMHDVTWPFIFDMFDGSAYVTSITLDALSIQNDNADDEIQQIVLSIPDIANFWKNINFQYRGSIQEQVYWQYIPAP
jgi:hypothetical protein